MHEGFSATSVGGIGADWKEKSGKGGSEIEYGSGQYKETAIIEEGN